MIMKSMKVYAAAVSTMALTVCALSAAMGGCSSSSAGSTTGTGSDGGSGGSSSKATGATTSGATSTSGGGSTTAAPACSETNAFTITFAPMYSAVIPGATGAPYFVVPAIVTGVNAADVTWSSSPSDAVTFSADPETGGAFVTINPLSTAYSASVPSATVTITAQAGDLCGTSSLFVTTTTMAEWTAGQQRYNDGVAFLPSMKGFQVVDGGARYACTDCHTPKAAGADAGFSPFNDVAHTPQQTGGFSDAVLLNIIQNGEVPGWSLDGGTAAGDAGYFDPSILPSFGGMSGYDFWHQLHQWNLQGSEVQGIVAYLRSLTPTAQGGTSDFGGHGGGPPPDGGFHFRDGGFGGHHRDGGFGGGGSGGGGGASSGGTGSGS